MRGGLEVEGALCDGGSDFQHPCGVPGTRAHTTSASTTAVWVRQHHVIVRQANNAPASGHALARAVGPMRSRDRRGVALATLLAVCLAALAGAPVDGHTGPLTGRALSGASAHAQPARPG